MSETESRRSPRVRPGRIVRVTVLDPSRAEYGTLIDISETGMGLFVESPFDVESTVHVEFEDYLLVGTVVYCRRLENGFLRLGLQLVNRLGGADWEAILRKWQPSPPVPSPDPPSSIQRL